MNARMNDPTVSATDFSFFFSIAAGTLMTNPAAAVLGQRRNADDPIRFQRAPNIRVRYKYLHRSWKKNIFQVPSPSPSLLRVCTVKYLITMYVLILCMHTRIIVENESEPRMTHPYAYSTLANDERPGGAWKKKERKSESMHMRSKAFYSTRILVDLLRRVEAIASL